MLWLTPAIINIKRFSQVAERNNKIEKQQRLRGLHYLLCSQAGEYSMFILLLKVGKFISSSKLFIFPNDFSI